MLTRGTVFLDDRIEGAGGSINDLAHLTMNHFQLAASNGNKPLSSDATWLLHIALDIVLYTDGLDLFDARDPETTQPQSNPGTRPLCFALASPAFVKLLTLNARTLSVSAKNKTKKQGLDGREIANSCLSLIVSACKQTRAHRLLRVAIQNGLLHTILSCAKEPGSDSSHGTLRSLVAQVLAPASVHHHVLKDLALAYVALPDDIGDPAILTPRRRRGLGTIRHFVKDSIDGHECI
ncbi:hypothetical protein DFH06DRAFT_1338475 [Mycena polygramma]|nr:hypothetical protein DFH06DRAFT_1338475 [Mycena polygramma]